MLVPALLCALALLVAPAAGASGDGKDTPAREGGGIGGDLGLGAQVARLYEDAALATQRYEAGRQKAEAQRAQAQRIEALLERERRQIGILHEDLGRIARAQYRSSGGMPLTAQLILAKSPDQLMRGQHVFSQTNLAVNNAIEKNRRAEARLAADEARAEAAWQALDKRNAELAELKKGIEQKLEAARWQLQGQADASVAAGSCAGAVRLDQPQTDLTTEWVAPVESYELSAAFGSGGSRWANRHTGQDFAVPIGTPVRAVGDGRVVRVSSAWRSSYGTRTATTRSTPTSPPPPSTRASAWTPVSGSAKRARPATPPVPTCTSRYGSPRRWARRWIRCHGWRRGRCRWGRRSAARA
jgi:murein DD-endopeptidase MepM/ murein hydrolase activator NlpD